MIVLETSRLILRNYRESDLEEYHKMLSDKENMYFISPFGIVTTSVEESRLSLQNAIAVNAKGTSRRFCIALKEDDKLIGAVAMKLLQKRPLERLPTRWGGFLWPSIIIRAT